MVVCGGRAAGLSCPTMFLDGRLSAEEETELVEHLDACDACRERLESMAADIDDWSDVRVFLGAPGPSTAEATRC